MDSNDPCPHCGPLEAEVERLRLEVERATHLGSTFELFLGQSGDLDEVRRMLLERYRDRIRELEQALAEAQSQVVQWVSVEEREPETEGDYVVLLTEWDPAIWFFDPDGRTWDAGRAIGTSKSFCVTHWAPLPKPPEEGTR